MPLPDPVGWRFRLHRSQAVQSSIVSTALMLVAEIVGGTPVQAPLWMAVAICWRDACPMHLCSHRTSRMV